MTRITWNDIDESKTLSAEEQKAMHGGFFNYFGFTLYYAFYNSFVFGYGGFNNVFQQGTFGFGVQAATFQRQAAFDQHNQNFLNNF